MDDVARVRQEAIERIGEIASNLLHPLVVRLVVDARDRHAACLQFDDEENEVAPETGECQHLHGEQVGGREPLPVCIQKRRPARPPASLGCVVDPVLLADTLDRVPGDLVPEVDERSADLCLSPSRVIRRHPDDEFR